MGYNKGRPRKPCAICGGSRASEIPARRLWTERDGKSIPVCPDCSSDGHHISTEGRRACAEARGPQLVVRPTSPLYEAFHGDGPD